MGKLADRYGDAARSGVYRVRDAAIPRRAAAEAGAQLAETRITDDGGLACLTLAAAMRAAANVLVIPDAARMEAAPRARVLHALADEARAHQAQGRSFFVVLVDPEGSLAVPPLYKERASAAPRVTEDAGGE